MSQGLLEIDLSTLPCFNGTDYDRYSREIMPVFWIYKLAHIVTGEKAKPTAYTVSATAGITQEMVLDREEAMLEWEGCNYQALGFLHVTCAPSIRSQFGTKTSAEVWTYLKDTYDKPDTIKIVEDVSALCNLQFTHRNLIPQIVEFEYHYERLHANPDIALTSKLAAVMLLAKFPPEFARAKQDFLVTNKIADDNFDLAHVIALLRTVYDTSRWQAQMEGSEKARQKQGRSRRGTRGGKNKDTGYIQ